MAYNKKYAELGESVIDYVNNMNDAIEGAFDSIGDYVIERGQNSRGSWEKYESGKLIQYGIHVESSAIDQAYGALYRTPGTLQIDFPITFKEPPQCHVMNGDYDNFGVYVNARYVSAVTIRAIHVTQKQEQDIIVSWIAIGRWK